MDFEVMKAYLPRSWDALLLTLRIGWQGVERKFLLPPDFAGKQAYTVAIDATPEGAATAADKRNFIWVIFGGNGTPNEVWRGRLNKLGFERE